MKLLVNCDQVFDILTRGPFPTGDPSDEAVEQHLRACHDCRQLAEALRPAVELLHEAVATDQALTLPGYQGSLPPADRFPRSEGNVRLRDLRTAAETGQPRSSLAHSRTSSRSRAPATPDYIRLLNAARFIAAAVLVAALGTLLLGLVASPHSPTGDGPLASSQTPGAAPVITRPDPLVVLASLQLPASCFPAEYRPLTVQEAGRLADAMSAGQKHALRCCTECHKAREPQPHSRLIATTGDSCIACHRG